MSPTELPLLPFEQVWGKNLYKFCQLRPEIRLWSVKGGREILISSQEMMHFATD